MKDVWYGASSSESRDGTTLKSSNLKSGPAGKKREVVKRSGLELDDSSEGAEIGSTELDESSDDTALGRGLNVRAAKGASTDNEHWLLHR